MLHSEDSTGVSDYRTTLFTNFHLFNLIQQWNKNIREKRTKIPTVSPKNNKWTTKDVSIMQ